MKQSLLQLTLGILILSVPTIGLGSTHLEKDYQRAWCAGKGKTEVVLPDRTRCDCLTDTHAIEFDFGKKWAEAIGQSLFYSLQTGKRAGVVLILEKASDRKFFLRLNSTIQYFNLPIDTWPIEPRIEPI